MSRLRTFPLDRLVAKRGTIGGFLFENIDLPRTLFHEIVVPNKPFLFHDVEGRKKTTKTEFRFDFIQFPDQPFRGYKALVGRTFEFPVNPTPGYIDGSIYLLSAHNSVDVVELAFLAARRGSLDVRITLAIDFESEGTGYANTDGLEVEVSLRPEGIRIDPGIMKRAKRKSPRALLDGFVEPGILGDLVSEEGQATVRLRDRDPTGGRRDAL